MERIRIFKPALISMTVLVGLAGCGRSGYDQPHYFPPAHYSEPGEQYPAITENHFMDTRKTPLSTFALEVDKASYANVRRILNEGNLPSPDAVRLEEFVNYFPYHYPAPTGDDPLGIHTAVTESPWNSGNALVRIAIKAKDIPETQLPPANLVFLVDVSGSMQDWNKLPLLKEALHMLTDRLRPQDRVAIVAYAGNAGVVLPSTPGSRKWEIHQALENLEAGGGTGGQGGIEVAYAVAQENFHPLANNRVILATDGDFNVGLSNDQALGNWIAQKKETGIFLSVLGFGSGNYQEKIMQSLAQNGNGNAAYIDQLSEAKKVLVNEFAGTLFTVAQDVKVQVEWNPAEVASYRLLGYETRLLDHADFNNDAKDAGEIGAGHTVTALYEVVPQNRLMGTGVDQLKYGRVSPSPAVEADGFTGEWLTVKVRYQLPGGSPSQKLEKVVRAAEMQSADPDFQFAMAAASFAMVLRNSPNRGEANFAMVEQLARNALREGGYDESRQEMLLLVEKAQSLPSYY